ncbi:hypothetical protein CHUAL_010739, partial [Chamberlinius hualienensis]
CTLLSNIGTMIIKSAVIYEDDNPQYNTDGHVICSCEGTPIILSFEHIQLYSGDN